MIIMMMIIENQTQEKEDIRLLLMSSSYWLVISVFPSLYLCVCGEAIPLKSILDIQIQF